MNSSGRASGAGNFRLPVGYAMRLASGRLLLLVVGSCFLCLTIVKAELQDQGAGKPPIGAAARDNIASPFRSVGMVSGIEVIEEVNPPVVTPDASLAVLLGPGTAAFKAQLEAGLTAAGVAEGVSEESLLKIAADSAHALNLARFEIVRAAGTNGLDSVLKRSQGKAFLTRLLSDQDWLDDFLVAGPFSSQEHAINALHALCSIFRYDKECTVPIYRKLASAYARFNSTNWEDDASHFNILDRFQAQKQIHKRGRMHAGFDRMETWEMTWITVTRRMGDSRAVTYMADLLNYRRGNYYGACWTIPYRSGNRFGDSIHGRSFYTPWANEYHGEVLRHKVAAGVCGTLSNFGAGLARAHGIASFPAGQPGHCAYMLRASDENWGTAYSVSGDTRAGTFFGGGDETIVRLTQEAYANKDRKHLLLAYRFNWMANYLQTQYAGFTTGEQNARDLSLAARPLHYNHWKWYAGRLAAPENQTSADEWLEFSHRFVDAVGRYQRPTLMLLNSHVVPSVKKLPVAERYRIVLDWHKTLPKAGDGVHGCSGRHFPGYLKAQAALVVEDAGLTSTLFEALLTAYVGTSHFSSVLGWGQGALAKNTEGTRLFLETIERFATTHGDATSGLASVLGNIVMAAEKKGDVDTFTSTSLLAERLLTSDTDFKSIYHTSKDVLEKKALGVTAKFSGRLVSANALPTADPVYNANAVLAHHAALQPDRLGFIIAKKSATAHVDLKLPGRCRLSGLVVVSRFETAMARSFPMKVSHSVDGETWEHLGTFKEPKDVHAADFSGKAPEAQWLRFERDNDKTDHFELRGVRVYGTPLY